MIYSKYKIKKHPQFPLYVIAPEGKGSIPKVLVGSYTSVGDAIAAIDQQEAVSKGIRDAKTKHNG